MWKKLSLILLIFFIGCEQNVKKECKNLKEEEELHLALLKGFTGKIDVFLENKQEKTFDEGYEILFKILGVNNHILEIHKGELLDYKIADYEKYRKKSMDFLMDEQYYRSIAK